MINSNDSIAKTVHKQKLAGYGFDQGVTNIDEVGVLVGVIVGVALLVGVVVGVTLLVGGRTGCSGSGSGSGSRT